jgi:hypothetical protein
MLPLLLSAFLLAQSGTPARPSLSDVPCSLYSGCLNLDTDSWKQPSGASRRGPAV